MKLHNTEINTAGMELSKSVDYAVPSRNYEKANDQHVRNITLYADDAKKLYVDSAKTKGVTSAELVEMFNKSMVLVATATGAVKPTEIATADGVSTLTAGSDSYYSIEKA